MPKSKPLKTIKSVPDPRSSKAHPEHRSQRKQWEKQHSYAFEWMSWVALALTGVAVAFDIEKDVRRCEERKESNGNYGSKVRAGRRGSGGEGYRGSRSGCCRHGCGER